MVIKRLETEDEIRGKAYVHCQSWKEAYIGIVDQTFLDNRTLEMSVQRAQKAFDNGISTFIAKEDNRVIGFIDYGSYREDGLDAAGEVYAIYILKQYYGNGIGYSLMQAALENLKEYQQVAVWVLEKNERAIRFYTRCGFDADGKKQSLNLGKPVTEVRMILKR